MRIAPPAVNHRSVAASLLSSAFDVARLLVDPFLKLAMYFLSDGKSALTNFNLILMLTLTH